MTKQQILELVSKIGVTFKALFPTKTQVATDIENVKTEVKAYADQKVGDGTNGLASTTYVDNKIQTINTTIASFQGTLDDKIDTRVASLGTFLGTADKYADLPTKDQNGKDVTNGDVAYLSAKDGVNKKGYYRYDGTQYVWMSADLQLEEVLAGLKVPDITDETDDTHFMTLKQIKDREDANQPTQEEVDQAVGS